MKIATMDTAERNGQPARAGHPFVAARTRAGNSWVVCLTDAAGSADEERAGAAAALANQAFLEACRAYEGLQAGTRLQDDQRQLFLPAHCLTIPATQRVPLPHNSRYPRRGDLDRQVRA